ncbi:MAG TPA: amphi-Trp domain-containing protein [Pseudogracilibacillus sp.]|nr:amphi-Trp domain-containing protein [Pseudogracilibacillus sp.]
MTQKKPKVVHVDYEEKMNLDNAITFLETIVTKLKEEKAFTLTVDGKSHHVSPASQVELEVKLEEENGEHAFEFELEWKEGQDGSSLSID